MSYCNMSCSCAWTIVTVHTHSRDIVGRCLCLVNISFNKIIQEWKLVDGSGNCPDVSLNIAKQ